MLFLINKKWSLPYLFQNLREFKDKGQNVFSAMLISVTVSQNVTWKIDSYDPKENKIQSYREVG